MKIKVEGEGLKPFQIEVKEFNLTEREDLNEDLYDFFNNKKGMFKPAVRIIRLATVMTDEEINEYSNNQIYQMAIEISNVVNKSKKK